MVKKDSVFFFAVGFVALCLGIYGVTESILAAIGLPVAALSFRLWHIS